jgi:putative N6-adenine-specific DNA methylase
MAGGQAHVLCGASELTRHLGLRTNRKFPVRNGPIDCRWLRYELGNRF